MKKCSECNIDMIEDCVIEGQHPFELGADGRTDISLFVPTGNSSSFLGIPFEVKDRYPIKARFCPKCGKVEIYVNPQDKR